MTKPSDNFLRLEIFAGEGCEGFTYKFKFDNQIDENDLIKTIAVESKEITGERIGFAVGKDEVKLLKGATLDYA